MIPAAVITGWGQAHPWSSSAQVEQDLVLSRALVEIYQDPLLADALVFRGGTALHKLLLAPAARYSEDLDFVQRESAPVGVILDQLQKRLNPWLGEPRRNVSARGSRQLFADNLQAKLKNSAFQTDTPPLLRPGIRYDLKQASAFIEEMIIPLIPDKSA